MLWMESPAGLAPEAFASMEIVWRNLPELLETFRMAPIW